MINCDFSTCVNDFSDRLLVVAQYEEKILEPRYSPEFIKEMLDSENDEVIGPFENADELKAYIKSLPDEAE